MTPNPSTPSEQAVILLVDDNPVNLQVLFQTLNGEGYKLLAAKNGIEALRIALEYLLGRILR